MQTTDVENKCVSWQCMTSQAEGTKSVLKIQQELLKFKNGGRIIQEKIMKITQAEKEQVFSKHFFPAFRKKAG